MASLNKMLVIGHLGRDPESRYTGDGKQVATFSVAATEKWTGGEHTEWFSVVAWEKLAGICQKYLHKGSQVFIEGRLRTREYETRLHEHYDRRGYWVDEPAATGARHSKR